jgi:hypothetical protein
MISGSFNLRLLKCCRDILYAASLLSLSDSLSHHFLGSQHHWHIEKDVIIIALALERGGLATSN